MATITGLTADRMLAIEAATVTSGTIDETGHLILTRHDGTEIDAGNLPDAIPAASSIAKGIVELATSGETAALTDDTRAVTPAALASALKASIVSGIAESATPTSYPSGVSVMSLSGAAVAWSLNSGNGTVVTEYPDIDHCQQTFHSNNGGTGVPKLWVRSYNTTDNGGGWTPWQQVMVMANLNAASFSQTTAFAAYPKGQSRLYYTTVNSSAWDFAGKAGEVLTYSDGVDFARQTWTRHVGGTTSTEMWVRTANSAQGWSPWKVVVFDDRTNTLPKAMAAGVVNITPTANTVTTAAVTFPAGLFTAAPVIQVTANTSAPGVVTEVSASSVTASGCNVSILRSDTTSTGIWWTAIQM